VVGAVFNDAGQILLVEHVFRPDFPWGLPGGWVEVGESPAEAVQRELEEELNLQIRVKKLLFCETQGGNPNSPTPLSLGLAFYCRLRGEVTSQNGSQQAYEVLNWEWIDPANITWKLVSLQRRAIELGKTAFEQEAQRAATAQPPLPPAEFC
jgi:ADP-ribose pyrophosphatase YjhB (NUDIX family)